MSSPQPIAPLEVEGVSVVPQLQGAVLHLRIAGAVEMRDPGDALNPYWNMVDEEARRRKLKQVELDVRDLNFMNSSGILTLVRWITRAKSHSAGDSYQLVLRYDRNVTWQRTSIPTLAKLAPSIVTASEIDG
jgi:hypothetical protein